MIDEAALGKLRSLQTEAAALAEDLGLVFKNLTDTELTRFGRAFERQFVIGYPDREVGGEYTLAAGLSAVYTRHQGECLLGGMIAKEQMDAEVDGEQPGSNKIGGPVPIRACYFGIGDDWEDIGSIYGIPVAPALPTARGQGYWTPGAPQDWIHSGTLLMGGVDGRAIRIGENAVHVVIGLGSMHASPKIENIQFTINAKEKPILKTFFAQKQVFNTNWKELDNAYILKNDDTVLAKVFISEAYGSTISRASDYPYLIGVSYVKEPELRLADPVTAVGRVLPGATHDTVYVT